MSNTNKVWIEIEQPPKSMKSDAARKMFRERQCSLANKMLERLCGKPAYEFFYSERECRYCLRELQAHTYVVCNDNGHWFSLDYFGRDGD